MKALQINLIMNIGNLESILFRKNKILCCGLLRADESYNFYPYREIDNVR